MAKKELIDSLYISKSKKGRTDGAYSRLLGNNELGALISRIHATSISAGNFIETFIGQKANLLNEDGVLKLFQDSLLPSVYLVTKKLMKSTISLSLQLEKKVEPDFLIVDSCNKVCLIIELKDGDNFDTKKAQGEVDNLKQYAKALHPKLPFPWKVKIKVCMFNQDSKEKIVSGFKNRINVEESMTGDEFCNLLGVSKLEIDQIRLMASKDNFSFVLRELVGIKEVRDLIGGLQC